MNDDRLLKRMKWGIGIALAAGWMTVGGDPFWRYFLATIFSFWILWVLLDI